MRRVNLFTVPTPYDESDPDGFRAGMARFGADVGAERLGGSVYELPPGQSNCPYHWEHGDEEWLVVLGGRPTVRHPEGEEQLEPGDTVCFPAGPQGAHQIINRTDSDARVFMFSTRRHPSVAVYPDSDKVGVYTDDGSEPLLVRRSSAVDYFDGETAPG